VPIDFSQILKEREKIMYYPILNDIERLKMLDIPKTGKLDIVLDTDAFNEIDDQFAIVYALCSNDRINLNAIYAAPFVHNSPETGLFPGEERVEAGRGMELSYQEIIRLMKLMNIPTEGFVFRGVDRFMQDELTPVENPAADDLIARAKEYSPEHPLYVVAIGAPTNVASAIIKAPEIIKNIVVIWQGGNAIWWPHTDDYNLRQDVFASRVLLNSGVSLFQVPAMGGTYFLLTSVPELEHYLGKGGPVARYLTDNVRRYAENQSNSIAYTKAIWDIGAIALLIEAEWMPSYIIHSPIVTDDLYWAQDPRRHMIRMVYDINRDAIMRDMFKKVIEI
jgi:inosine-uridine nucleoside N-ribohydrolase